MLFKHCAKVKNGVPVRIRIRADMASARDPNNVRRFSIKVTHPDGSGKFRDRRVVRVRWSGEAEAVFVPPPPAAPGEGEIGTGA